MGTALALSTFSILGMVPTPSYLHVLSSRPFCQWWCFSVYRWWDTQVGHFLPSDEPKIESPKSDFKALLVMLTCSQCSEVANCELTLSFLGCNKCFLQKAKSHNHVLWFLLFSAEIILCKSHCGSSSAVSLEFSHVCWIRDSFPRFNVSMEWLSCILIKPTTLLVNDWIIASVTVCLHRGLCNW